MTDNVDLVLVRTRNNPTRGVKKNSDSGAYSGRRMPPYGIMYIAGYARQHGHTAKIYDLFKPEFDDVSAEQVAAQIVRHNPKVVGFSSMTSQSVEAMKVADAVMRISDAKVVHGGVHPATLPEQALQHGHYVVRGDGENAVHEILTKLKEAKQPQKLGLKIINDDSSKIIDGKLLTVDELDAIPAFRQAEFDETAFDPSLSTHFPVITARGCPYRCVFCKDGFGLRQSKVRYHSVDYVMDLFDYIQNKAGFERIIILDDIFLSSEERMEEMIIKMQKRGLRFKFQCQVHANVVKPQFIKMMHQLGIEWVYIGIESGNDKIQKKINKGTSVERITNAVNMLKTNGFYVAGMFMIGNVGETKETVEDTIKMAYKLPLDRTWFSFAAPYPGTPFYDMVEDYGEILEPDFGKWNQVSLVYRPKDISKLQMYRLMGKAQAVRIFKKARYTTIGSWEAPLRRKLKELSAR